MNEKNKQLHIDAARRMDWMQVVLNQGPPCFHLDRGRFCGRAERWDGHFAHGKLKCIHKYVSFEALLKKVSDA